MHTNLLVVPIMISFIEGCC